MGKVRRSIFRAVRSGMLATFGPNKIGNESGEIHLLMECWR